MEQWSKAPKQHPLEIQQNFPSFGTWKEEAEGKEKFSEFFML